MNPYHNLNESQRKHLQEVLKEILSVNFIFIEELDNGIYLTEKGKYEIPAFIMDLFCKDAVTFISLSELDKTKNFHRYPG